MYIEEILKEKIIERKEYINNILDYVWTPLIKVIVWMRRVGKSYIMKYIIQYLIKKWFLKKENILYINKEDIIWDYIDDYIKLNDVFTEFVKGKSWKIGVFLDEVQEISWWEKFVRSLLEKYKNNIEIFVTWSNSEVLSSDISTLIWWRYIEFHIYPLSFEEYSKFRKKRKNKELFFEYLKYWWLPGIFNLKFKDDVIFNYLKWIYNTILLKDIVRHFWVRNIDFFEKLYMYIFSNIWNIFSSKKISDYLRSQNIKISVDTILNYINYWLKSFVLFQIKWYSPETKKFFEIYDKYYAGDLWLRNSIVWFNLAKDINGLLENYVFLILKKKWYNIYLWRLKNWKEIDFVVEKQGVIKYFQVCYLLSSENVIEREFSNLENIRDNWEKFVVSLDDISFWIKNGIKHISILDIENIL